MLIFRKNDKSDLKCVVYYRTVSRQPLSHQLQPLHHQEVCHHRMQPMKRLLPPLPRLREQPINMQTILLMDTGIFLSPPVHNAGWAHASLSVCVYVCYWTKIQVSCPFENCMPVSHFLQVATPCKKRVCKLHVSHSLERGLTNVKLLHLNKKFYTQHVFVHITMVYRR